MVRLPLLVKREAPLNFVALGSGPIRHGQGLFLVFKGLLEIAGVGIRFGKGDEAKRFLPAGKFAGFLGGLDRFLLVPD